MGTATPSQFGLLTTPPGEFRRRLLGAGISVTAQALLVLVLVKLGMSHPGILKIAPHSVEELVFRLEPPPPKPVAAVRPVPVPKPVPLQTVKLNAFAPPTITRPMVAAKPEIIHTAAPAVVIKSASPSIDLVSPTVHAPVILNQFASDAPVAIKNESKTIASTAFGDTSQAISQASHGSVASGGFDLAAAGDSKKAGGNVTSSGFGDAAATTGKARGGAIAISGFGDSIAGAAAPQSSGTVHSGGFGDAVAAPMVASTHAKSPAVTPVQILLKPDPLYTAEARALHLQGEVLLHVTFEASGEIRVGDVVHGLGHGLDESALAAAKQIRFKPATRDGVPVDSDAVLHVTFQLAD